jgi:nucleotide-binding universal stress UspA family protein/CBS domain-containing protein
MRNNRRTKEENPVSFPFHTILLPVDFDENSKAALDLAREFAAAGDVTLHLVHAMALLLKPGEASSVVVAREKDVKGMLEKIAREHLGSTRYHVHTRIGDTASAICEVAHDLNADLIVMPTHGRHGLPRFLLGSVAERVVRDPPCPVLTVRPSTVPDATETSVGTAMIKNPPSIGPADSLADAQAVMQRADLSSIPVTVDGVLTGIITDRDIRAHADALDKTKVQDAMSHEPVSVRSTAAVEEAARKLMTLGIGALPVVDGGKLVGLLSPREVIKTLLDRGAKA